jgi:hypothetical protein
LESGKWYQKFLPFELLKINQSLFPHAFAYPLEFFQVEA